MKPKDTKRLTMKYDYFAEECVIVSLRFQSSQKMISKENSFWCSKIFLFSSSWIKFARVDQKILKIAWAH